MAGAEHTSDPFTVETLPSREEWLAKRREGLGASDAPAILGVSPWASPFTIYCDKRGVERDDERRGSSERLKWGALLQDPIAKELGERLKIAIELRPPTTIWRNTMLPWLQCSLDGETTLEGERGAVEIKTASIFERQTWTHEGEVPLVYQVQAQHQMAVTGYQFVLIGVLIGTEELRHTIIPRDPDFIPMLVNQEERFWAQVERGEAPPADGSEEAKRLLRKLSPPTPGEVIDLTSEEDVELDALWRKAVMEAKAWEAKLEEVKNAVTQRMGTAALARLINGSTWQKVTRKRRGYVANVKATEWLEVSRTNG